MLPLILSRHWPPAMRAAILLSVAIATPAGVACGEGGNADPQAADPKALRVVTTVSPITSLVENVGGSRIRLEGIVPEGVNSHTFEPAPSVAQVMAEADLVVLNGLFLEEPSLEMAEANKKPGAVILALADRAISRDEWVFDFSFPEAGGHPNPHLWTSPMLAFKYAELIRDELARLDADNADYYNGNYEKLKERLEDLDRRISDAVGTIPPENRRLLTYHDSFPFFGSRYGLEIVGAVQPSDFTEPSARDVAGLIDLVRETGSAGDIRLGGLSQPSHGADRQGGRSQVRGPAQGRRPARVPRRPAPLLHGADADERGGHGRGPWRERRGPVRFRHKPRIRRR